MDILKRALAKGQVSGYERVFDGPKSKGSKLRTLFQHRLVHKLLNTDQWKTPHYSASSVETQLQHSYGKAIVNKVTTRAGTRPLSARKIIKLHNQAISLKHKIDQKNEHRARKWGNVNSSRSMAAKLFQKHCGYSCKTLPAYEKARLHQSIQEVFFKQGDHKITRQEAQQLIQETIEKHRFGFSAVAPKTAEVISRNQGYEDHFDFALPDLSLPKNDGGQCSEVTFQNWQKSQGLTRELQCLLNDFQANSSTSARLQWHSPFEQLDSKDWDTQLREAQEHKNSLDYTIATLETHTADQLEPALKNAMARDIDSQLQQADNYINFLQALKKADFRTADNFKQARLHSYDTALSVIRRVKLSEQVPRSRWPQLDALGKVLESERQLIQDRPQAEPVYMRQAIRADAKVLRNRLVEAGLSQGQMKKLWKQESAEIGNSRQWKTINKVVPVRDGDRLHTYNSVLVPANQMRMHIEGQTQGERDPFPVSYYGTGRSSADTSESQHALNLFSSRLEEDGEVLFSGLRTGTMVPATLLSKNKGKAGDSDRAEIAEIRSRELLEAAFVQQFSGLSRQDQQRVLKGEPLTFNLVSSSMLSPDTLRHKTGIHDDEYTFQTLQNETLHRLCREPIQLDMVDSNGQPHRVTADIKLATFNIPVNNLALNKTLAIPGQTWVEADRENDLGLEVLLGSVHGGSEIGGMVGNWLQGEGEHSKNREKVLQLVRQIRTIYTTGQHRSEGKDAFKLVERVQLLASMIGAVPHFNCKSGKDRTGEADARIKDLAAEVNRRGQVPEPDAPLTQAHKESVQAYMYGSGNLEVQWYNINVPGFKVGTGKQDQGDALYRLIH